MHVSHACNWCLSTCESGVAYWPDSFIDSQTLGCLFQENNLGKKKVTRIGHVTHCYLPGSFCLSSPIVPQLFGFVSWAAVCFLFLSVIQRVTIEKYILCWSAHNRAWKHETNLHIIWGNRMASWVFWWIDEERHQYVVMNIRHKDVNSLVSFWSSLIHRKST